MPSPSKTLTCDKNLSINLTPNAMPPPVTSNIPDGFEPPECDEERLSFLNQEIIGYREELERLTDVDEGWAAYERPEIRYAIMLYEDERNALVRRYNSEVKTRLDRLRSATEETHHRDERRRAVNTPFAAKSPFSRNAPKRRQKRKVRSRSNDRIQAKPVFIWWFSTAFRLRLFVHRLVRGLSLTSGLRRKK